MAGIARNFFQNSSHFTVYGLNINMVEGNSYRYDMDPGGLTGDAGGLEDGEFEMTDKPVLSIQVLEHAPTFCWMKGYHSVNLLGTIFKTEPQHTAMFFKSPFLAIRGTRELQGKAAHRSFDSLEQRQEVCRGRVSVESDFSCQRSSWSSCGFGTDAGSGIGYFSGESFLYETGSHQEDSNLALVGRISSSHPTLGSRKNIKSATTRFISCEDVQTMKKLHRGSSFQVYSAKHKNRIVVFKEFFGSRAKQHLQQVLNLSHGLMDPCFLKVKGISTSESPTQFIVFDNACSASFELNVASALQEDQTQSVRIGFAIVGGLSAGLSYICRKGIPLSLFSVENLEIYVTDDDELKIGSAPSKTDVAEAPGDAQEDRLWEIFNQSCLNAFERANRLLYPKVPPQSLVAIVPASENETISERSNFGESSPVAHSSKPRRDLVWEAARRRTSTVELVAQHYQDYLDITRLKPVGSFALRQLKAQTRRLILQKLHQCPSYKREEITFTTTITENAIISHSTPFNGEICYVCGEQVGESSLFSPKATKGRVKGPVDYDKQCGVINDKGLPCRRSVTCKSHSMGAKRAVQGRSRKYDDLLLVWQREHNPNFVEPVKKQRRLKEEKEKLEEELAEEAAAAMSLDLTKKVEGGRMGYMYTYTEGG
ncbi:hypothetical protein D9758_016191 [Tetrapyrgos nigripes]|uniref:SCA7 domain-containing protein n=1 Tax=Tetrapyrgos nigripes TaxID=182062 RepID=A0A8H5FFL1_9AGAR|nr:hypothetical protein D9758_016191 [Tetrapyrgos nigripes]